jgi:golgi phosphoprotein 3
VKDPHRRRLPLPERLIEVIDDRQTGETILDEALKMIKSNGEEKLGINSWIDLLSGKTALPTPLPIPLLTPQFPQEKHGM